MPKLLIPCDRCKGCGKLDADEKKPWSEVTATPNPKVRSGELQPVECPKCKGAKRIEGTKQVSDAPTELVPVADGLSTNTGFALTNVAVKPAK